VGTAVVHAAKLPRFVIIYPMSTDKKLPTNRNDVNAFLQKVASTPLVKATGARGRLLFAMDATASREPMWDHACHIQGEMFKQTSNLGGLDVQLCYYRGFAEFYASDWFNDAEALLQQMSAVHCLGGHTQIEKVLKHAIKQARQKKLNALVFVGDCMEENVDTLCQLAGELSLLGVPVFLFHEGKDATAEKAFRQIAQLSNGAYCPFDASSAQQLQELLSAVAVFAAGGKAALTDFSKHAGTMVKQLTRQLK